MRIKGEILTEKEVIEVLKLQREFLESYAFFRGRMSIEKWLTEELHKHMPEYSREEVEEMCIAIIDSINIIENEKKLLQKAIILGRSKESWFAMRLLQLVVRMSADEKIGYFKEIFTAVGNTDGMIFDSNTKLNEYDEKEIAIFLSEQVGNISLDSVENSVTSDIVSGIWDEESSDEVEINEEVLVPKRDISVKIVTAGALKVASEKGVLKCIPKRTAGEIFANIAFNGNENVKVFNKVAKGELTANEGIDAIQQTKIASIAGILALEKGAEVGKTIGMVLGPVGAVIGGVVCGAIGYVAGTELGTSIVKGVQKVRNATKRIANTIGQSVKASASNMISRVTHAFSS